jgi:hypothetical protein
VREARIEGYDKERVSSLRKISPGLDFMKSFARKGAQYEEEPV